MKIKQMVKLFMPLAVLIANMVLAQNDEYEDIASTVYLQKNVLGWWVMDGSVNEDFIGEYLQYDTDNVAGVQEDDMMSVYYKLMDNGYKLYSVEIKNSESEEIVPLDMDIVNNQMSHKIINRVKSRQYDWDDINPLEIKGMDTGKIRSIFPEINYKTARDLFWWTQTGWEVNATNSMFFRFKEYPVGIAMEFGEEEVGYPSVYSHSVSFGIATEQIKYNFILPMKPFIKGGDYQPLESGFGFGLKFDSYRIGGTIVYKDLSWISLNERYFIDPDNVVMTKWHVMLNAGRTFSIPEWKFIHSSTLRTRLSLGFHQLQYGSINFAEDKFNICDQTSPYESVLFIIKLEWLSNLEKSKKSELDNRSTGKELHQWKSSLYIPFSFAGRKGIHSYISYGFSPLFRIGLHIGYNSPVEFKRTDGSIFQWEPGYIISPEITFSIG